MEYFHYLQSLRFSSNGNKNVVASEAKFNVLNFQNFNIDNFVQQCLMISAYQVNPKFNWSASKTIKFIKKEANSIANYSCLIFCIFADCQNSGFECKDRMISIRELLNTIDQSKNFRSQQPIIFLINDFKSTGKNPFSSMLNSSNVYISINTIIENPSSLNQNYINYSLNKISTDIIRTIYANKRPFPQFDNTINNEDDSDNEDVIQQSSVQNMAKEIFLLANNYERLINHETQTDSIKIESNYVKYINKRKCLILSYDCTKNKALEKHSYTEKDVTLLENMFQKIEFDVTKGENLSVLETHNFLKQELSSGVNSYELITLCLIANFEFHYFECADGPEHINTIIKILSKSRLPESIPKVLIILDCFNKTYSIFDSPLDSLVRDKIYHPKNFVLLYSNYPKENAKENNQDFFNVSIKNATTCVQNIQITNGLILLNSNNNNLSMFSHGFKKYKFNNALFKTIEDFWMNYDFVTILQMLLINKMFISTAHQNLVQPQNIYFKSTLETSIILKKVVAKNNLQIISDKTMSCDEDENDYLDKLTSNEALFYKINNGICFLLDVQESEGVDLKMKKRTISLLKNTIQNLNFKKIIEIQKSANSSLNKVLSEILIELMINTPSYDCFVLFIYTDCHSKSIVDRIVENFIVFSKTIGNPKLFFVFDDQAKKPNKHISSRTSTIDSPISLKKESINPEQSISLKNADFMLFKSSQDFIVIYTLCQIIEKNWRHTDLITMLGLFSQKLAQLNGVTISLEKTFLISTSLSRLVLFEGSDLIFKPISNLEQDDLNSPVYKITNGKCVIFASQQNSNQNMEIETMKYTFGNLGFDTSVYMNNKSFEITEALIKISKTDYSEIDCFVLSFIGHSGNDGVLHCENGGFFNYQDMIMFVSKNPTLKNKPKLFIIQTCRGEKNYSKNFEFLKDSIHNQFKIHNLQSIENPDLFIMTCTSLKCSCYLPNFSPNHDYSLLQTLCKLINENHKKYDLATLSTIVNRLVTNDKYNHHENIIYFSLSTLIKQVYL